MHFSVCYPVFPYTFYSIDFFCLAFPSRCLFSPLPSWYIIFTLPCVFVPLLYRYRGYFHFSSPLTEKKKKRERKTPVFFISIFFLYADILHLLPHPSFLSLRWPFSFICSSFSLSTFFLFFFLVVDHLPFLLSFSRSYSFPSFSSFSLLFFLFPWRPSSILSSFPFFSVSTFFLQYSPFCWLFTFHSSFSFSFSFSLVAFFFFFLFDDFSLFSFSQLTFSLSPCRNSSSIFLSLRRPSLPTLLSPVDCLPFFLLLPLVFSLPFFLPVFFPPLLLPLHQRYLLFP